MNRKIYNENMVRVSTLLAGPFAGAYLMAENFKTLGEAQKAKRTLKLGILISMLAFITLLFLPEKLPVKMPYMVFPLLFTITVQYFMRRYQANGLENFVAEGGLKHSAWKVAGVSLLAFSIEVLLMVFLAYIHFLFFA